MVILVEELIKIAAPNGLYAVLFVFLLFWVLKENSKREDKYQDTIGKLADKLTVVETIQKDICIFKEDIKNCFVDLKDEIKSKG